MHKKIDNNKITHGFTIIELTMVIVFMAVLAGISVMAYLNIQNTTRDKETANSSVLLAEVIEKYYDHNGTYPICNDLPNILADNKVEISGNLVCDETNADKDNSLYYKASTDPNDGRVVGWELGYFSLIKNSISDEEKLSNRRGVNVIAIADLERLQEPRLQIEDVTETSLKAKWNQIEKLSYYELEYSNNESFIAGTINKISKIIPNQLTKEVSGLLSGNLYHIRLRAIGDKVKYDDSAWSDIKSLITKPEKPLITTETYRPKDSPKNRFRYTIKAGTGNECNSSLSTEYKWYENNSLTVKATTTSNQYVLNDFTIEDLRNDNKSAFRVEIICKKDDIKSAPQASINKASWANMQIMYWHHIEWEGRCNGNINETTNFGWEAKRNDGWLIGSNNNLSSYGGYFSHSKNVSLNTNGSEQINPSTYNNLTATQKRIYANSQNPAVIYYKLKQERSSIWIPSQDIDIKDHCGYLGDGSKCGYSNTIDPLTKNGMGFYRNDDTAWGSVSMGYKAKSFLTCNIGGTPTLLATGIQEG